VVRVARCRLVPDLSHPFSFRSGHAPSQTQTLPPDKASKLIPILSGRRLASFVPMRWVLPPTFPSFRPLTGHFSPCPLLHADSFPGHHAQFKIGEEMTYFWVMVPSFPGRAFCGGAQLTISCSETELFNFPLFLC